jgi:hypothetical protein
MIERFVAPALTFIVLIAGHVAIASALLAGPAPQTNDQSLTARAAEQAVARQAS